MMSAPSTLTYVRRAFTKVKRELVDEFERHLAPILLGDGERLLRTSATSRSNRSARSRRLA